MHFIDGIKRLLISYVDNDSYRNLRVLNKDWYSKIPKLDSKIYHYIINGKKSDGIMDMFINQSNKIPKRVESLELVNFNYNAEINKMFPKLNCLTDLQFTESKILMDNYKIPQKIENIIFSGCKFGELFDKIDLKILPTNLKTLVIVNNKLLRTEIINYPKKLKFLYIHSDKFNKELINLPNLEKLLIESSNFNKPLYNLPNSLKELSIVSINLINL